jgi:hypothetical protein
MPFIMVLITSWASATFRTSEQYFDRVAGVCSGDGGNYKGLTTAFGDKSARNASGNGYTCSALPGNGLINSFVPGVCLTYQPAIFGQDGYCPQTQVRLPLYKHFF